MDHWVIPGEALVQSSLETVYQQNSAPWIWLVYLLLLLLLLLIDLDILIYKLKYLEPK
jgi:hypothetical protein